MLRRSSRQFGIADPGGAGTPRARKDGMAHGAHEKPDVEHGTDNKHGCGRESAAGNGIGGMQQKNPRSGYEQHDGTLLRHERLQSRQGTKLPSR